MNQTFSFSRFGRLLRKYFTDNKVQLLANLGLLVGALFVACVFAYQGSPAVVDRQRDLLFFLFVWPCWYIFTVQQTTVLNQKERAVNYLMQPASQFEKMALIWFISGLGFVVVYLSVFALMDTIGVSYVNNRNWTPEQLATIRQQGGLYVIQSIFNEKSMEDIPTQLWAFTALLHSFTLAFTLLIRKYTLPIVVIIAFALLIFGFLGNNYFLQSITDSGSIRSATPFSDAIAESPTNQYYYRKIEMIQPIGNQIRYAVGSMVVVLLYIMAYFRLKEREV
ncbi:hypothetical protein [Spirosoma pollinicola]|uniref:Uncharacterized protein n=1 Tax=Spirosoma pollinicola TaxID=2057025 RepID=A0A2K8Z259_9BACT|nr:hypothetical protein [Spirosoma pollinicola]AUD03966.1 hypothetical protein CWM47_20350 [Spirosoma pollinicola]